MSCSAQHFNLNLRFEPQRCPLPRAGTVSTAGISALQPLDRATYRATKLRETDETHFASKGPGTSRAPPTVQAAESFELGSACLRASIGALVSRSTRSIGSLAGATSRKGHDADPIVRHALLPLRADLITVLPPESQRNLPVPDQVVRRRIAERFRCDLLIDPPACLGLDGFHRRYVAIRNGEDRQRWSSPRIGRLPFIATAARP
jgi:hypothetical protein